MNIINRLFIGCIWFLVSTNSHAFVVRSGGRVTVDSGTRLDLFLNPLLGIFINNIAFTLATLALVIAGCSMVWGGEFHQFASKFFSLIFTISLTIAAPNLLFFFFNFGSISSVNING